VRSDGVTGPSTLDLESLWNESLRGVMRTVSSPAQRQWLSTTHPVGFSDDTVVLASPHAFAREWLERSCGAKIRAALSEAAGRPLTVVITVQTRPEPVDPYAAVDGAYPVDDGASPPAYDGGQPVTDATPATGPSEPRPATDATDRGAAQLHRDPAASVTHQDPAPAPYEQRSYDALGQDPSTSDPARFDHTPAAYRESAGERPGIHRPDGPLQAPGRPAGPTVSLPEPRIRVEDVEPETQLNPKYSFDDFVIGSSNRFAHAAATAVAEAPAKSYNPLFIYGGAGLGKTHLLHAIGHYVRNLYPRLKVRYVTTEQFTNEFINAIRDDGITQFQRTYRQADVLLIDDIQFLQQKERTQEEFFHTFNALHNAEKQIVISSDRPPKQIAHLEDRLRSRFEWGLMTDVQPPDLETRIAILRKKSETDHLSVQPDVLELIASKVQSNIRELEGALIRVSAFASLQRAPADSQMAEAVLKDLFPDDRNQEVSVQLIMDEVAAYFSLTVEDLCSPSRSRQLVTARQIAMYLARELTDLSLPRIGKAFGGRDHTTVMHAKSKIAGLMQERRTIYNQVQELTNRVKTRARGA
jgi:chromosomal replication initiator protein